MLPFYQGIKDNLEARGVSSEETRARIKFREKVHMILDELPRTCDILTMEANQKGDTMDSVLEKFRVSMDEAVSGLVSSNPEPTPEQMDWVKDRLDHLMNKLVEKGDKHIKDLDIVTLAFDNKLAYS